MVDDVKAQDYNADVQVRNFIEMALFQSEFFASKNIMMTFGDDFHYQDAHRNYKNIDKLIRYKRNPLNFNQDERVHCGERLGSITGG